MPSKKWLGEESFNKPFIKRLNILMIVPHVDAQYQTRFITNCCGYCFWFD